MTMDEMYEAHGSTVEFVLGDEHHTTVDERGRAVVGPRRHAQKARRFFRGRTRATQTDAAVFTSGELPEVPVPAPDEHASAWERARYRWLVRFYDKQWHQAVQHSAVDLMMWSVGLGLSLVFLKGAWWVIGL